MLALPAYYSESPYVRRSAAHAAVLFAIAVLLAVATNVEALNLAALRPLAVPAAVPFFAVLIGFIINKSMPNDSDVAHARIWAGIGQALAAILLPAAALATLARIVAGL